MNHALRLDAGGVTDYEAIHEHAGPRRYLFFLTEKRCEQNVLVPVTVTEYLAKCSQLHRPPSEDENRRALTLLYSTFARPFTAALLHSVTRMIIRLALTLVVQVQSNIVQSTSVSVRSDWRIM